MSPNPITDASKSLMPEGLIPLSKCELIAAMSASHMKKSLGLKAKELKAQILLLDPMEKLGWIKADELEDPASILTLGKASKLGCNEEAACLLVLAVLELKFLW